MKRHTYLLLKLPLQGFSATMWHVVIFGRTPQQQKTLFLQLLYKLCQRRLYVETPGAMNSECRPCIAPDLDWLKQRRAIILRNHG